MVSSKSDNTITLIRDAVVAQMKKTDIPHISVKTVIQEAGISRSTFYRYYDSVDAVVKSMENEILEEIGGINRFALMERCVNKETELSSHSFARAEVLERNRSYITAIVGPNGDPQFQCKAHAFLRNYFSKKLDISKDITKMPNDFCLEFLVAGYYHMVNYWITERPEISAEDFANILQENILTSFSKTWK